MAITKTYDFTSDTDFTFDTDKIEHSTDKLQLKNLLNSNVYAVAGYEASIHGYAQDGSLITGVAAGGASVSGGYLDLTGGTVQYVEYSIGTIDAFKKGSVRIQYKPNFTGAPSANQVMYVSGYTVLGTNDALAITHLSSGNLRFVIRDKNDVVKVSIEGSFSVVSGTDYIIEANWDVTDSTDSLSELYVDGVRLGVDTTYADRDKADKIFVGRGIGSTFSNEMSIGYIFIFTDVQHTGSGYTETDDYISTSDISQVRYSNTDPKITYDMTDAGTGTIFMDGLSAFTDTHTNNVKHILYKDGSPYYYSGGWTSSDESYSQSNTAAEINTNAASFTSTAIEFGLKSILNTAGDDQADISALSFTYDFAPDTQDTINKTIVFGYVNDITGSDLQLSNFTIKLSKDNVTYKDNVQIEASEITVTVGTDGYWEAELIDTANMESNICYIFNLDDVLYKRTVPQQTSIRFNELEVF